MRRAVAAIAVTALAPIGPAGCRQVLGIPGDFSSAGIRVGGTITGAVGASAASVYLSIDGVQVDSVVVTADGDLDLFTDTPGAYTVTADAPCSVARGTGTVTDTGVDDVAVTCDGLSSLRRLGISAPVSLGEPFVPSVEGYMLDYSILTQEITVRPEPNYPDTNIIEVRIGGSVITPTGDHYGPVGLDDASDLSIKVRHASVDDHTYLAGTHVKPPAPFGYGKASDSAASAWFGAAVAADGDVVVVGAPEHAGQTGEAFVYRRTDQSWVEDAHLVASDAAAGARFGASVAVAGDVIAIGAPGATSGAGAAYLYRRDVTGWVEARVTATGGAAGDGFGTAVGAADDLAVIGAPGESTGAAGSGAAYVFEWTGTWTQRPMLKASTATPAAGFGRSVAATDGVVVVGAPTEDDMTLIEPGAAYVFTAPTWAAAVQVVPDVRSPGDHFGAAVAIAADGTLAVGAPQGDPAGIQTGLAYLFNPISHEQTDIIVPDNASAGDGFGASIAIAGSVLVVGAPQEDSGAPGTPDESASAAGAVMVYTIDGAGTADTGRYLKASNIDADDQFGAAVALTLDQLVVGAPFEDSGTDGWSTSSSGATNGQDEAGAAYAFR